MSIIKRTGDMPIWVSRKDADGLIYKWSVGTNVGITVLLLGQIAAILWLLIAVAAAVVTIANAVASVL